MKLLNWSGVCGLGLLLCLAACGKAVVTPSSSVTEKFPSVVGDSLAGGEVRIPEDFSGKPVLLLVGYEQKAQFDIDRWILGVLQTETPVKIVEVPTIAGMMPQMVQSFISNGMRRGIPKEDWSTVVTVFGDADKIIQAIGNEKPNSAHVVLLDASAKVAWLYSDGYSASNV